MQLSIKVFFAIHYIRLNRFIEYCIKESREIFTPVLFSTPLPSSAGKLWTGRTPMSQIHLSFITIVSGPMSEGENM